ncbi:Protein kinase-like domain protein, partial [Metarhizium majus ARSEF 297]
MDPKFDDGQLLDYSDAQISHYINTLPTLPKYSNITLLSTKYLAKAYLRDDAEDATEAMKFASELGIHVPRIKRTVQVDDATYCIMDRIQGATLATEWLTLGWIATIRLAFQLHRIIRRLRSVKSATAGSLATGQCRSYYLDDSFGLPPGASLKQVNAFMNFWLEFVSIRHEIKKTTVQHSNCPKRTFSGGRPFVFTHHDLSPRNIMLDPSGQLWLIDWDCAGFYPEFFEYAGMHNFIPAGWDKFSLLRWRLFALIAGGPYYKKARLLEVIRSKITRFRPARRFNMNANGYAAASGRRDTES